MLEYLLEAVIVVALVIGACEITKLEESKNKEKQDGNSK